MAELWRLLHSIRSTTHRHLLNRVLNFGQAGLLDRYIPPRATSTSHPSTGSGFNDRRSLNFFSPFFLPDQLRSLALRIYYNGQSLLCLLVYTLSPLRASYHRSLNPSLQRPLAFLSCRSTNPISNLQLDKIVGLAMLVAASVVFLYYTIWTLLMVSLAPRYLTLLVSIYAHACILTTLTALCR